ncbi:MAG: hypothetical protein OXD47_13210 [Gammaproteobacteria bacterium]|nr:hypothetical protein [Gammaproteobacteria bacterium]MCY4339726.1 hypothetical protein [Gammaproteobacteria bacterium]
MSPELIGIITVGVSLGGLMLVSFLWTVSSISGVDRRLARLEGMFEVAFMQEEALREKPD